MQVPVACWEGRLWARISAQYYNTLADYQALADAVEELIREGEVAIDEDHGITKSFRMSLANGSGHIANGNGTMARP